MIPTKPMWLVTNSRSGSNNARAIDAVRQCCEEWGHPVVREIAFPDEQLPDAAQLDAAGIGRLAIFTGDGTLNAAIARLQGWGGEIVVLPGGTMNLLSVRLHGRDTEAGTILQRIAAGAARAVRPLMVNCAEGSALAGLLAGPGTAWASVREAMRDFDVPGIAEGASEAIAETARGPMVRCADPALGRDSGYPLIEFTPSHRGIQLDAFHAEGAGELLQQSWALLRRNFRQGPHTRLALVDEVTLESCDGSPLSILVDGEPKTLPSRAKFAVAPCEVDLLATHHGY